MVVLFFLGGNHPLHICKTNWTWLASTPPLFLLSSRNRYTFLSLLFSFALPGTYTPSAMRFIVFLDRNLGADLTTDNILRDDALVPDFESWVVEAGAEPKTSLPPVL